MVSTTFEGADHNYLYVHTISMGHHYKCRSQLHDSIGAGTDVLYALHDIQGLAA